MGGADGAVIFWWLRQSVAAVYDRRVFLVPKYNLGTREKAFPVDEVVFAEKGDMHLLGARSLEGLNLAVDSRKKKLVAAGAVASSRGY